ncbi:MAG TPA: formate dehydrogenase subunit delta [Acetobacteraceae bacterium]|jgi:formate dehydrogenase subunit delta
MSPEHHRTEHKRDEKLVAMANQIGLFFSSQADGRAAADIATHLRKFWTPHMRAAIVAHLDEGGAGLSPTVHEAVGLLRDAATTRREDMRQPTG